MPVRSRPSRRSIAVAALLVAAAAWAMWNKLDVHIDVRDTMGNALNGVRAVWKHSASGLLPLATLVVALTQARLVHHQGKRADVSLTRDILNMWREVQGSWAVIVAMHRLDEFYSHLLQPEELKRVKRLRSSAPATSAADRLWLSDHLRLLLTTLGRVAELVLSGRLQVPFAYSSVGTDLVRSTPALRAALFNEDPWLSIDTLDTQQGLQGRVLALIDIMWAEAVRRGDLSDQSVANAADRKSELTGRPSRSRVRDLSRESGATRWTANGLARSLKVAERPPTGRRRWFAPDETWTPYTKMLAEFDDQ